MSPPVGSVPEDDIVAVRSGDEFRAVVVPQTVAAGTPLVRITVDGISYNFTRSDNSTYVGGKLHKIGLQINRSTPSGDLEFKLLGESVTPWESDNVSHNAETREYIVIDCPTAGTLKECIAAANQDLTQIKNLKVRGTIDYRDIFMMRDEMTKLQSINLKEVTIAECEGYSRANEILDNAFSNKSTLVRFVFPDNITKIGDWAFSGTNISGTLIIPNGVTEIGSAAFWNCSGLTGKLILPKNLEKIGYQAFWDCKFIGNLDIPSSVKIIENGAFGSCRGFTGSLNLPHDLEELGNNAFCYCSGFTGSLTIPHKITKVEAQCFCGCSGLDGRLTLHNGITEIDDEAFADCKFTGPLKLPEELLTIGSSAFSGNNFTSVSRLPKSLAVIGEGAFNNNHLLSGTIEFPSDIISIASGAFSYCYSLEGIVLPKGVESVRSYAFGGCTNLKKIVCRAQYPPYADSDAFSGVNKETTVVEVAETSVADYRVAPVWQEFKFFGAHQDFTISREQIRALNAEMTKSVAVSAPEGMSWSIESAPEWVTVAPTSGTGKGEVTVTVSAMDAGAETRTGEIVYLLDGKNYRARTVVEQYDYEYGDGDVVTVQTATKGSGVNLVFMGDCFDAKDISEGTYLTTMNEAVGHFFAIDPFNSYREWFNIYIIFGLSPDTGMADVNTVREACFGSKFLDGKVQIDEKACFEYACKAPTVDENNINKTLITLIENNQVYESISYLWGDGSAISVCPISRKEYPYDFRGMIQHEAGGHGFAKLGDEHVCHNDFIQTGTCDCCPHIAVFEDNKSRGWYENLALTGNMHNVPWSHMMFDEKYNTVVDIYEGGHSYARGVFRSEQNSCMNNFVPYYSAIQRETMVKYIKQYAGEEYSYDDFKANDELYPTGTSQLSIAPAVDYGSHDRQQPVYMGEKPQF